MSMSEANWKVKMKTLEAGPNGIFPPGCIRDVTKEQAEQLIPVYAELAWKPEEKPQVTIINQTGKPLEVKTETKEGAVNVQVNNTAGSGTSKPIGSKTAPKTYRK
jgi:hypothetical protein